MRRHLAGIHAGLVVGRSPISGERCLPYIDCEVVDLNDLCDSAPQWAWDTSTVKSWRQTGSRRGERAIGTLNIPLIMELNEL